MIAHKEADLKDRDNRREDGLSRESSPNFSLENYLIEYSGLGFEYYSPEGKVLFLNQEAARRLGGEPEGFIGRNIKDIYPGAEGRRYRKRIKQVIRSEKPREYEDQVSLIDGGNWYLSIFSLIRNPAGAVNGVQVVTHDISGRKQMELALRESEERFRTLIENLADAVFVNDLEGRLLMANRQAIEQTGYSHEELLSMKVADIDHGSVERNDSDRFWAHLKLGERVSLEVIHRRRDGSIYPAEIHLNRVDLAGRPVILAVVRDVTERRKAEDELRTTYANMSALIENTDDSLLISDREGSPVLFNSAYSKVMREAFAIEMHPGLKPHKLIGDTSVVAWWDGLHERVLKGERFRENYSHTFPKGNIRHFEVSFFPVKRDGEVIGFSEFTRDITARRLNEDRIRASLNEKDALLKEIHHRVKNNLQIVVSLLNLQSERIGDREALSAFENSRRRIMAMARVHESLYQSKDFSKIRFREYMKGLVREMMAVYRTSTRVSLKIRVDDLTISIDKAIPCGLIINELLSNALKHAFPGARKGRILVSLTCSGEGRCRCEVRDDGIGIPPEIDPGSSDTLGLMLVRILARQISGTVSVERESGTRISVDFNE